MLTFSVFQNELKGPSSVSFANQIGSSSNDTRAQNLCTAMVVKCVDEKQSQAAEIRQTRSLDNGQKKKGEK